MKNSDIPEGFKPTELGPLPEGWEVVRLGDVVEKMKAGGTPHTGTSEFWGGDIPLVKVENVVNANKFLISTNLYITKRGLENSSAWVVPQNSLILTMYGTPGEVCINKIPVAVTQNVMGIITKENITTVFLYYALKFAKIYTLHLITDRTIFTHFTLSKAKNLIVPFPPLSEQKKIAAVLSTVQSAKEKTEAVIEATRELKKSLMKHLFTYGPVSLEEAENVPLVETEIGLVPEGWEVVRLGDVCDLIMGQSPPGSTYNTKGNGFPFLQGKAEFGDIHPRHVKFTTDPKKLAPKNSILMSVRAPVGDVNIADIDYCIGRGLASISLINGDNKFLFFTLTLLKPSIEKEGSGSTFKAINKSHFPQVNPKCKSF